MVEHRRNSSPTRAKVRCAIYTRKSSEEGLEQEVITDRFAGFQAEWLNVHVDFPLLQRLAHPITIGAVIIPASRSTSRASSACSKSSCMAVLRSAAGRPGRCIKPSSTPSTSLRRPTA